MKWAGGAVRQDGVPMLHIFEEMHTRTPADPNEAALEAIMPQAGMEGTPTRGERATPTEEAAGNAAAWRTTTPSHPGEDPGRYKGHLTGTGRGQRHGHSDQG